MECEIGLRRRTYHVLCGLVLNVWARVEDVLASAPHSAATKMQVVRLKTSDGIKLVGEYLCLFYYLFIYLCVLICLCLLSCVFKVKKSILIFIIVIIRNCLAYNLLHFVNITGLVYFHDSGGKVDVEADRFLDF